MVDYPLGSPPHPNDLIPLPDSLRTFGPSYLGELIVEGCYSLLSPHPKFLGRNLACYHSSPVMPTILERSNESKGARNVLRMMSHFDGSHTPLRVRVV